MWTAPGRAHIEVRGIDRTGNGSAARDLERRLARFAKVHQAEVNAALGRVVVAFDDDFAPEDLLPVIEQVEREHELAGERFAPEGHPGDHQPLVREAFFVGANVAGFGASLVTRALPVRIPALVPTLVAHADGNPRLRQEIESRIGRPATNMIFGATGVLAHTLGQRRLPLVIDSLHRLALTAEARARIQAWQLREADVCGSGGNTSAALSRPERPAPLRSGPVERIGHSAAPVALAAYGGSLLATRNSQRAHALLAAGTPKAALLGRDTFCARLGQTVSRRGVLTFEPEALRRLDRIDTVIIDSSVLVTGRLVIGEIVPISAQEPESGETEHEELHRVAHELVDVGRLGERHARDRFAVEPLERWSARLPADARQEGRAKTRRGATMLVLTRDERPVALVSVISELDPLAEALVAASRKVGRVVLAGVGSRLDQRLPFDDVVPGGPRLLSSLRAFQAEGYGVALISGRGRTALAAADVGIGVIGTAGAPPWGAHLMTGPNLSAVCLLIETVPTARLVSRRSAQLTLVAAGIGGTIAALSRSGQAAPNALRVVGIATLLSMASSAWSGMSVARRPPPAPADRTPWHALPAGTALRRLQSSPHGLPEAEAARRRGNAGGNNDPAPSGVGVAWRSAEELANPLTLVLAASAGVSAALGSVMDSLLIGLVLGGNAVIGGFQRVNADRALRRLAQASAVRVLLRRDGEQVEATADRLVPGDVIALTAGDAVPADCRVLAADDLDADESSLTGESQLVTKTPAPTSARAVADRHSMLYEGTTIAAGNGIGVVVATGEHTEIGRTVRLAGEPSPSGVAARLRTLTKITLPISLGASAALTTMDLVRGRTAAQALGSGVSLAVAAVPEGLPLVASVAELAAARRLSRRGALVRNPSTIEALGRVDVLCFDKTGTLTEGRIRLRRVSDGVTTEPAVSLSRNLRNVVAAALRASPDGPKVPHPTDRAVLRGAAELEVTPEEGVGSWRRIDELKFEPGRGYHAVLGRATDGQRLSVKGAPEVVLDRCDTWRGDIDGGSRGDTRRGEIRRGQDPGRPFDDEARRRVEAEVERLARDGYRVLAVAERPASDRRDLTESRINGLRFLGLLGLADPVRLTAAQAVDQVRQAGVDVVMVTGDHPSTAEAIAAELDAVNGRRIMSGPELDAMDDDTLVDHLPNIAVFARVSPAQKVRIVEAYKRAGRVVAVTGDGANDAPAIRLADVGVAVSRRATPAAREAADVVVTDDHIETITDAIVEGRAMWASVRDALAILLGGNLGEIAFTLGTDLLSGASALGVRQLLLVNLLTDVLPAMAVAVRPPPGITREVLLEEGPEASLGSALTRAIYIRAGTTAGAAGAAWLLTRGTGTRGQADTSGLVALVAAQLGQTIVLGGRSPLVITAGLASLATMGLVVQTPGVSHFFGCRPLTPHAWAIALGSATAATILSVLLPRLRGRGDPPRLRAAPIRASSPLPASPMPALLPHVDGAAGALR